MDSADHELNLSDSILWSGISETVKGGNLSFFMLFLLGLLVTVMNCPEHPIIPLGHWYSIPGCISINAFLTLLSYDFECWFVLQYKYPSNFTLALISHYKDTHYERISSSLYLGSDSHTRQPHVLYLDALLTISVFLHLLPGHVSMGHLSFFLCLDYVFPCWAVLYYGHSSNHTLVPVLHGKPSLCMSTLLLGFDTPCQAFLMCVDLHSCMGVLHNLILNPAPCLSYPTYDLALCHPDISFGLPPPNVF